jgi:hypothetical protein
MIDCKGNGLVVRVRIRHHPSRSSLTEEIHGSRSSARSTWEPGSTAGDLFVTLSQVVFRARSHPLAVGTFNAVSDLGLEVNGGCPNSDHKRRLRSTKWGHIWQQNEYITALGENGAIRFYD